MKKLLASSALSGVLLWSLPAIAGVAPYTPPLAPITQREPTAKDDINYGWSLGQISQLLFTASGGSGNTYVNVPIAEPTPVTGCTTATITLTMSGGSIATAVKNASGSCYGATQVPTVRVDIPTTGTPAVLQAVPDGAGGIGSYTIKNPGSGYLGTPLTEVDQSNGNGGALFHAVLTSGVVTAWKQVYSGRGYTAAPKTCGGANCTGDVGAVTNPAALTVLPTQWYFNGSISTPYDLTAGAAKWLAQDINDPSGNVKSPYSCDVGATECYASWGSMKLAQEYTGNAFTLLRASDSATLAIPFVGNYPDYSKADAFCYMGTTCTYQTLYNQGSAGSNCDATYNTVATAPIWTGTRFGDIRPIIFDTASAGAPIQTKYMNLPTTCTITPGTSTVTALLRARSSVFSEAFLTTGASAAHTWNTGGTSSANAGVTGPGAFRSFALNAAPDVLQFNMNGTASVVSTSRYSEIPRVPTAVTSSDTGGSIGYSNDLGGMALGALVVNNASLTAAQSTIQRNDLILESHIFPQTQDIGVHDGDSKVYGVDSIGLRVETSRLQELMPDVHWYNTGIPGQTLATKMSGTNPSSAYWGPLYDPTVRNFIFYDEEGINDMGLATVANPTGMTLATMQANIQAEVTYQKSLGSNVRVVLMTYQRPCAISVPAISSCPRSNTVEDALIVSVNAWIRANYRTIGADSIVDVDADAIIGGPSALSQPSLSPDGLHGTNGVYAMQAQIAVQAIQSIRK